MSDETTTTGRHEPMELRGATYCVLCCISRYGGLRVDRAPWPCEVARLRERVAVLTEALRTVAECRGDGAWYCKSDVAATALSRADDGGRS